MSWLRFPKRFSPFHGAGMLLAYWQPEAWQVLLFRRRISPHRGTWGVVGGRREPGESPQQAAIREAAEEAFGSRDPGAFFTNLQDYLPTDFDIATCPSMLMRLPFFSYRTFCVVLKPRPPVSLFTPDPYECDGCQWAAVDRLPQPLHPQLGRTLRHFRLT